MFYWLSIITMDNWIIAKKNGLLGFNHRFLRQSKNVKPGDRGFIYIQTQGNKTKLRDSLIVAEFEILSSIFFDETILFDPNPKFPSEKYPLRCKIKILRELSKPIIFREIVPLLSFIRTKRSWGMYVMGKSMVALSKFDVDIIQKTMSYQK